MKASKFSDAQKAFIIKQCEDGTAVAEICRKAGISPATYFNWKKRYAGLLPTKMKRLKQLEDENSRLKKIVADLTPDRKDLSLSVSVCLHSKSSRSICRENSTYAAPHFRGGLPVQQCFQFGLACGQVGGIVGHDEA